MLWLRTAKPAHHALDRAHAPRVAPAVQVDVAIGRLLEVEDDVLVRELAFEREVGSETLPGERGEPALADLPCGRKPDERAAEARAAPEGVRRRSWRRRHRNGGFARPLVWPPVHCASELVDLQLVEDRLTEDRL